MKFLRSRLPVQASRFPPLQAGHWLYAGMVLVIAPHTAQLNFLLVLLALLAVCWRWLADVRRMVLPGKALIAAFLLASVAMVLLHYRTLFGRDAGVSLLTLMLALKLLEMRTYRDAMLSVFLGYFVVMTHFLYTQSIPLALYLFAVVMTLTVALIRINHRTPMGWRAPARQTGLMVLQAMPVMLLLFVLYPRIPGPLWGLPGDAFSGISGLSDELAPGSISRLVQSDEVAFRAEFAAGVPANPDLYWRAHVMDRFDGRTWRATALMRPYRGGGTQGSTVRYSLTIEPHDKHWVFALDTPDPLVLPRATRLTGDLRLLADAPLRQRLRVSLGSRLSNAHNVPVDAAELARNLELPPGINPRTRALASQLKARGGNAEDLALRVLDMIREQPFAYTLSPPLLGENSVDAFLFDTRSGFCEHYASAFTFLMRAAGVPARIVAGYQGGEYNNTGDYLVVRQSDAHAWSEIWVKGKGWLRIDPTFAVAAERIENGIDSALGAGEPLPFLMRRNMAWLKTLRQQWDAINNQWNQWVLNYDQERQIGLFSRLGFGILSWQQLVWALGIGMGILLGVLSYFVFRIKRDSSDPAQALYLKYCAKLGKLGLPRKMNEGPQDYAARVILAQPQLADDVQAITRLYTALRYAPVGADLVNQLTDLKLRIRCLKPRPAPKLDV